MAILNFFNPFGEALAEGKHNLETDQMMLAMTAGPPGIDSAILTDLTEIVYTYCNSRLVNTTSSGQTSGAYRLILADLTLSASGGAVGPFRYFVLYNADAVDDDLIGWYDLGSDVTIPDGSDYEVDFDDVNGALELIYG